MPDPLSLLTVHAHPDDEASKGAATCARYAAAGVRTTLVCATGGEEGDILNPAMDSPENKADLARLRRHELARSAEAIGFAEVVMLGYRDSGMPESEANKNPEAFGNAPFDEALERLVAIVRRTRPQVLITYGPDHTGYPHPDHIRVHEIGMAAFDAAGDPDRFPDAGEPWTPLKLYYNVWARLRFEATHAKMLELGLESPYGEEWRKRRGDRPDDVITTRVDVHDSFGARRAALLAHATQIDPSSPFWFGLPDDVARDVYPFEDWALARSRVGGPSLESGLTATPDLLEDDLFAGVPGSGVPAVELPLRRGGVSVAAYLSPAWLEEAAALLGAVEGPGPTASVQWNVTKAPGGDATFTWVLDDGVVRDVRPGPAAAAEVAFTATYPEHLELTRGARTPAVAFMQGKLKAVGHSGMVLAVLRRTTDPGFAAALAELGARSEVAEA